MRSRQSAKSLDSLSDLVSFGVAPGLLLMNVLDMAGAGMCSYIALFLPLMGALRLAKFNVDDSQATTFKGLPIPANAIFWIGVVGVMMQGKPSSHGWCDGCCDCPDGIADGEQSADVLAEDVGFLAPIECCQIFHIDCGCGVCADAWCRRSGCGDFALCIDFSIAAYYQSYG